MNLGTKVKSSFNGFTSTPILLRTIPTDKSSMKSLQRLKITRKAKEAVMEENR